MSADTLSTSDRIVALDVVRGVAVMGIFSVNIVGMAMIEIAYFNPPTYGFDSFADRLMYAANFLLIDGKMRALFSILFGASMLLVIDRAVAAGRSAAKTHFARMAALLVFGLIHFYLIWWGDILSEYALIGMVAFLFWKRRTKTLMIWSLLLLAFNGLPAAVFMTKELVEESAAAAPRDREAVEDARRQRERLSPPAAVLAEDAAAHESPAARVRHALKEDRFRPFFASLSLLPETLGLMLLGMAGYRAGYLTGQWDDRRYRRVALWSIGVGLLVSAISLFLVVESDFAPTYLSAARNGWTAPLRPVMALGYAALIILLCRNPGWLAQRVGAVGRTAFSNYLGCSLIGVLLFYGFGGDLYGKVSRAEAWLVVPPVWLAMLAWSKPWLDRFHYGPLEWAWRSLARWELQPMSKRPALAPAIAT